MKKAHPDARIRQLFHMSPEDEIWLVQRVRIIDHEAVILDTDILDASIIPELNEEILEQSLYSYIEDTLHLKIAYAEKGNHMPERERSGYEGSGYETV